MNKFIQNIKNNNNGNGIFNDEIMSRETKVNQNLFSSDSEKMEHKGFLTASQYSGNIAMLKLNFAELLEKYKESSKKREYDREKKKEPLKIRLSSLKSKKIFFEKKSADLSDNKIPDLENENISLHKEINNINNNFSKVEFANILSFSKPYFVISLVVLSFLTFFLFVFYMNAAYSAFMKNIGADLINAQNSSDLTLMFNSIFDPNTFAIAAQHFFLLIFIILAPFTVLAFGVIIHNLYKIKKYGLLFFLIVGVFIYDTLIAYQIVEKIHEAKYLTGLVESPWQFTNIFSMGEFYLMLMSGFVMYLVWGVLLHLVLEMWANSKPDRFAVKERYKKIEKNNDEIEKLYQKLYDMNNNIKSIEKNIADTEYEIENFIFLDLNQFKIIVYSFAKGWAKYLVNSTNSAAGLLEELSVITEDFLNNLEKEIVV